MPAMITQSPVINHLCWKKYQTSARKKISNEIEGKCIVEGYVKPGSCK